LTQDQISMLLRLLERIADRPFTITQATDWQMLYVLLGMTVTMLVIAGGFFWRDVIAKFKDIKESIKEIKCDDMKAHESIKTDYTTDINTLWAAMKDCQSDCCPPRRRRDDE